MLNLTREYNALMESDTHFRDFVESNKGKSIQELFDENGVNADVFIGIKKRLFALRSHESSHEL